MMYQLTWRYVRCDDWNEAELVKGKIKGSEVKIVEKENEGKGKEIS